jgi:histidinol-phosphate aminotransferase
MGQKSKGGPQAKAGIETISAYVPGKSGPKTGKVFKLSSNESPFGPSPKAIAAYAEAAGFGLSVYPDGQAKALRGAIAKRYNLKVENIVCGGTGSDELLQLLAHAYLNKGDEAIYSQYGFLVYPITIATNDATAVVAPEHNYKADVGEILARVTPVTKMIYLANPNNPTGTYLTAAELRRLHAGLPSHVVLVLDGAYAEFVLAEDYEAGIALVENNSNVVMTRTFSKIYGLAGVRLGWAYCPPAIADVLNRIRGPFSVSTPALAAGTAAMQDVEFIKQVAVHNAKWLTWLSGELRNLGLEVTPSVANFILVHFGSEKKAEAADAFLTEHNIIVRRVTAYGLPAALRITIGTEEANRAVVSALKEFLV